MSQSPVMREDALLRGVRLSEEPLSEIKSRKHGLRSRVARGH